MLLLKYSLYWIKMENSVSIDYYESMMHNSRSSEIINCLCENVIEKENKIRLLQIRFRSQNILMSK